MNTKYLAASCAFRRSASEGRRGCSSCSYKLKIGPLIGLEIYSNRQWFYCVKDLPIVTEDGDLYAVLTFGLDQSTLPLHTAGVQAVLVPWLCSDPTALGFLFLPLVNPRGVSNPFGAICEGEALCRQARLWVLCLHVSNTTITMSAKAARFRLVVELHH